MRQRATRALLLVLLALGLGVASPQATSGAHGVGITAAVDTVSTVPGRVERPRAADPASPHAAAAALPDALQLPLPSGTTPLPSAPTTSSYDGGPVDQGRGPPGA